MEARSAHSGSVAVFYLTEEHLSVEALQIYGKNAVIFQLALSGRRCFIVECFLDIDIALTIEDLVAAINQRPHATILETQIGRAVSPGWSLRPS